MLFSSCLNGNAFSVCYCAAYLNAADLNFNLRKATRSSAVSLLRSFRFPVCFRPPFLSVITAPKKSYEIILRVLLLLIIS